MKKKVTISVILLTLTFPVLSQTNENICASQQKLYYSYSAEQVDSIFASWNKGNTPGAAVLVIKDGQILLKKGYGLSNLESKKSIEPDTAFLLGSVTKQFTAMAIMMLAESGKLRYEDSLSQYFPNFPQYAHRITIRHLLHHTAGFPEYDDLFLASGKMDKDWPRSAKSKPSNFEPTAKDALQILTQVEELNFSPGMVWEYSNSNYVILAQIVEKVTGQPFSQFLRENIFQPLGMDRTILYDQTRPKIQNVATSYKSRSLYSDIDYAPQNAIYGEDNIYTTIEDMYKWDQVLYTEKLVKATTLKEAFTSGKLNDGTIIHYGFGWFIGQHHGLNMLSHSGSWLGFKTAILRFPDQHFSVIVLANIAEINAINLATNISDIYLAPIKTTALSSPRR